MLLYQCAILLVVVGVALLAFRNWRDYRVPGPPEPGDETPFVSILVPARNEGRNIEACLRGLLAQEYPRFEVVVLDDGSTDDTAERVRGLMGDARLRLLRAPPLPDGWAGKAHACFQASRAARGEWLLFVDADTRHEPELLSRAVSAAVASKADLLSTFPRQHTGSPGEALTVPFIYWVLFTLLPLREAHERPEPALCAACGQFLLVRRAAYLDTGGHAAIPLSTHDGLHLARRFKSLGRRVHLADLSPWVSCRMYQGWRGCWTGFTRNAFEATGSLRATAGLLAAEGLLFAAPFGFLAWGAAAGWPPWAWPVAGQVLLLLAIQTALRGRFGYPWLTVVFHPLGILLLMAIQCASALRALRNVETEWKGRRVGGLGSGDCALGSAIAVAGPTASSRPRRRRSTGARP